jgi:hypothetical protein
MGLNTKYSGGVLFLDKRLLRSRNGNRNGVAYALLIREGFDSG